MYSDEDAVWNICGKTKIKVWMVVIQVYEDKKSGGINKIYSSIISWNFFCIFWIMCYLFFNGKCFGLEKKQDE